MIGQIQSANYQMMNISEDFVSTCLVASLLFTARPSTLPNPLEVVWRHQLSIDSFEPGKFDGVIAFRTVTQRGIQILDIATGKLLVGFDLAKVRNAEPKSQKSENIKVNGILMRVIWASRLSRLAVGANGRLYRLHSTHPVVIASVRLPKDYIRGSKTFSDVAPFIGVEGDADAGPFDTYLQNDVEGDDHTSCYKVFTKSLRPAPYTFSYISDIGPLGALGYLENRTKRRSPEVYAFAIDISNPVSYVDGSSGKILWSQKFRSGAVWMGGCILVGDSGKSLLLDPRTRKPVAEVRVLEGRPYPSEAKFGNYYLYYTRSPGRDNLYDFSCYKLTAKFCLPPHRTTARE